MTPLHWIALSQLLWAAATLGHALARDDDNTGPRCARALLLAAFAVAFVVAA